MATAILLPCLIYLLFKTSQLDRTYSALESNFSQLGEVYSELMDAVSVAGNIHDMTNDTLIAIRRILNALVDRVYKACPSRWIKFQRTCYRMSTQHDTWPGANASCTSLNATLVIVNTETQQDFLANFDNTNRWIGLSRLPNSSTFRWANGQSLVTGYWSPGEPDNSEDKLCVRKTTDGTWKSEQCNNRYTYVCQMLSINYIIQQLNLSSLFH